MNEETHHLFVALNLVDSNTVCTVSVTAVILPCLMTAIDFLPF